MDADAGCTHPRVSCAEFDGLGTCTDANSVDMRRILKKGAVHVTKLGLMLALSFISFESLNRCETIVVAFSYHDTHVHVPTLSVDI